MIARIVDDTMANYNRRGLLLNKITSLSVEVFTVTSLDPSSSRPPASLKEFISDNRIGSITCIIGIPGSGKTTFLHTVLSELSNMEHLCLYFDIGKSSKVEVGSCTSFNSLIKESILYGAIEVVEEITDGIVNTGGKDTVILLDNFDGIDLNVPNAKTLIYYKMLSRELLPNATIIIAGPFAILDTLNDITEEPCRRFVLGIKAGSENVLLDHLRIELKADRAAEYVRHYCLDICSVPGILVILLKSFREQPPSTFSMMGETLILDIINGHLKKQNAEYTAVNSLNSLPGDVTDKLRLIAKLAYLILESDTDYYCYSDLSKHLTLGSGKQTGFLENFDLGLLQQVQPIDKIGSNVYKFGHKVIQEFLAAYFIATQPLLDQVDLFRRSNSAILFDGKYCNVSKFYFGMGQILNKPPSTSKFEVIWALKPILEIIIGGELHVDEELQIKRNKLMFVYQLLYECQDTNLVQKFLSRRERYLELILTPSQLSHPLIRNLAYILRFSGISKWSIETSESTIHSAEFIAMSVEKETSQKVVVYTDVTDRDVFIIQPQVKRGGLLQKIPLSSLHVRCMREVLHRVLQLYSPIKLKSSSTEPSYVSFLVCECLKEKFEKEQMLTIEPIRAIHWITVKMKEKQRSGASETTSEDAELYRHMAQHNMEQLEMVLMMSPLPNRICYKDPMDSGKSEAIELSRNTSPHFLEGRIAASLKGHLRGDEGLGKGLIAMETQGGNSLSEMVPLPFIIPTAFKDILGSVVLQVTSAHTRTRTEDGREGGEEATLQGSHISSVATSDEDHRSRSELAIQMPQNLQNSSADHEGPYAVDNRRRSELTTHMPQNGSSEVALPVCNRDEANHLPRDGNIIPTEPYNFHYQHSIQQSVQSSFHPGAQQSSLQPSVQTAAANSQKQVALPPGTVLHTANTDVFAKDIRYNLPDESNLLKKGGNGSVFVVTYGRIEYAVKKTAFRSREFQIHKKLKHENIIELSCFMFGTEQPQRNRRYFCYHFMPRLTGDLAKMVTDKPDLTMVSLSKRFENDPRALGSMQGNWKYILKELLKGLNYMHLLNIVHRDIKASNILIKMLCACDNPLTCTCSKKCSVKISDFDAALELDSQGSLQPVPFVTRLPHQQQLASQGVYQVIPVGTDGYRSPESSQLTLSNDLSVLRPALTVKTDIWSVGLILLRMLNGSNGPTRQQKVST